MLIANDWYYSESGLTLWLSSTCIKTKKTENAFSYLFRRNTLPMDLVWMIYCCYVVWMHLFKSLWAKSVCLCCIFLSTSQYPIIFTWGHYVCCSIKVRVWLQVSQNLLTFVLCVVHKLKYLNMFWMFLFQPYLTAMVSIFVHIYNTSDSTLCSGPFQYSAVYSHMSQPVTVWLICSPTATLFMLISFIQMTIWAREEHEIHTREFISSLELHRAIIPLFLWAGQWNAG